MAKHSDGQKPRKDSHAAEVRKELFKKLEPLSQAWITHLSESLLAVVPCSYCSVTKKDGIVTISAPKFDDAGQCLKCHGRMVLPDQDQRNWAADEIGNRLAPAPKTIEEAENTEQDFNAFARSLEGKSDEEIRELRTKIGLPDVK